MLRRCRAVLMGVSALVLTLSYWTPAAMGYGVWETMNATGQRPELSLADLRVFFLLGATFMALSGYAVTVPLLYAFYDHQRSWIVRAILNVGLFFLSVGVFTLLVGDSLPGGADLLWILLGVAGVVAAEATTQLLWGRRSALSP